MPHQGIISVVAEPHPQEPPCDTRLVGEVEKVLVLADDDPGSGKRLRPQGTVAEPTGQGRRQLVIDQKPHATSTTTWFVCWAA